MHSQVIPMEEKSTWRQSHSCAVMLPHLAGTQPQEGSTQTSPSRTHSRPEYGSGPVVVLSTLILLGRCAERSINAFFNSLLK